MRLVVATTDSESEFVAKDRLPKISVVMPTYNNAAYIPSALESIAAQGYPETEVIIIDDGSTDDTKRVVDQYGQAVRYFSQANAGPAVARNTGLAEATGEYVAFLDADDWFLPSKFYKQGAALTNNPRVGAMHGGWTLINEKGRMLEKVEPWHVAPKLNLATWINQQPVRLGAMLFRREWLTRVGGFDPTMRQAEDTDLLLRLAIEGCQFDWLKESTYCYRHHDGSMVRSRALEQAEYGQRVVDKFFANPKVPSSVRRWESHARYYSATWMAWHLFQTGNADSSMDLLKTAAHWSRFNPPQLLQDWTAQFASCHIREGKDANQVREMWPRFREVTEASDFEWHQTASSLELCLNVWQHYCQNEFEHGAAQLKKLTRAAKSQERSFSKDIAERLHFYTTFTPLAGDVHSLEQLWQDMEQLELVTTSERHHMTGLYLGIFGQSIWRKDIPNGAVALMRAIITGATPRAWPAWSKFVRQAMHYVRGDALEIQINKPGNEPREHILDTPLIADDLATTTDRSDSVLALHDNRHAA